MNNHSGRQIHSDFHRRKKLTGGMLARAAYYTEHSMSTTQQTSITATPKRQRGHTQPRAPIVSLDQPGRLRVANVIALLGISHSSLYAGLRPKPGETTTRYPKPDGRDGGFPYWKTATILAFLNA